MTGAICTAGPCHFMALKGKHQAKEPQSGIWKIGKMGKKGLHHHDFAILSQNMPVAKTRDARFLTSIVYIFC